MDDDPTRPGDDDVDDHVGANVDRAAFTFGPEDDQRAWEHRRPDGVDDDTVEALGTLSEALETCERARGHLYAFHQLSGRADLQVGEAAHELRAAGHGELAHRLEAELVGRNVTAGRWTFQVVEEYDDGYWSTFRRLEADVRRQLVGGRRHLYEAEMKEDRQTLGGSRPPR